MKRSNLFIVLSLAALFLLNFAGASYVLADEDKKNNSSLPAITEAKTTEVCVLNIGSASDAVGLGSASSPAFASNGPSSFAIDKDDNVYIVDAMNFRVIKVSKDSKIVSLIDYPKGETDNKNEAFYITDIAISRKNGDIYLLNQTIKNIFVLSGEAKFKRAIDIKEQVKTPHKLFLSPEGDICVYDAGEPKVVIYSGEGKYKGRLSGDGLSVYCNNEGYIFTLGEFDKSGRDILLMDAISKRDPKLFSKLVKSIVETEPYDYQILGCDSSNNLFASIVEKIAEDVIQTLVYKIAPDGKTISRLKVMPLRQIGDTMPSRHFSVSPSGVLYGVTASAKYDKYIIVKIM